MAYSEVIVNQTVQSRTKPGGGNVSVYVRKDTKFIPINESNGWLSIISNQWIPKSATTPTATPPPPTPDPTPGAEVIIRYSYDKGVTWTDPEYYHA